MKIEKEIIEELYVTEKCSTYDIATALGTNDETIRKRMIEFNINRRKQNDATKLAMSGKRNPMKRAEVRKKFIGKHCSQEKKEKIAYKQRGIPRYYARGENNIFNKRPELRKIIAEKMRGKTKTTEEKIKMSERMRGRFAGENHPMWKGGISFEPYCKRFNNSIKEMIRNTYGRKCYLCGKHEIDKKHAIHHVDYNKNTLCNGKTWGLIPLCAACHAKTQGPRWHWFNLLGNYWATTYWSEI